MVGPLSEAQQRNMAAGRRLFEINERNGPRGQLDHFDEFFHPEFDWRPAVSGFGDQTYIGVDGYRTWIDDVEAIATKVEVFDVELHPAGDDHILALGRLRLVGKESGLSLDSEYGILTRMEDGRALSGRAYLSHAEAEEAAADAQA